MNNWRRAVVSENINPDTAAFSRPNEGWTRSVAIIGGNDSNEIWDENINPAVDMQYLLRHMQGIIIIDKIGLRSPVLDRVTEYNLDIAICSVVERNRMGQTGNYVLSGHNSRIHSRHFNRLHELTPGDIIILDDGAESFNYAVTDVFTVSASDTWVMQNDGDRKLLTLITCYYGVTPTGRLIVKAELIP